MSKLAETILTELTPITEVSSAIHHHNEEWETEQAYITLSDFDHDLKVFDVYGGCETHKDVYLGSIIPGGLQDMYYMIDQLNNGDCPIIDGWEDGQGNTCNALGFNNFQNEF